MTVPESLQKRAGEILENEEVSSSLRVPLMNVRDDSLQSENFLTDREEAQQIIETVESLIS